MTRFDCVSCEYDAEKGEYRFSIEKGWTDVRRAEVFVFTNKSSDAIISFMDIDKNKRAERVFAMRKENGGGD